MGGFFGGGSSSYLFSATADKSITNTTVETSLIGTVNGSTTLPAGRLTAGARIEITLGGIYTVPASPESITVRVKFGSTVLAFSGTYPPVGAATSKGWFAKIVITCRTTGATGTVRAQGVFESLSDAGNITVYRYISTADTTIDTTASQVIDATLQFGVASAANTFTCTNADAVLTLG